MDKNKITQIYRENVDRVYKYTLIKLGNRAEAEDITSEVFVKALEKGNLAEIEYPTAWLITFARNLIFDHYKKTSKKANVGEEVFSQIVYDEASLENTLIDAEQAELIKRELDQMNTYEQEVITMKIWNDMKFREIAEVVKKNESAVKLTYYRGLEKIKERLEYKPAGKKMRIVALPALALFIKNLGKQSQLVAPPELIASILNFSSTAMTSTAAVAGIWSLISSKVGLAAAGTALVAMTTVGGVAIANNLDSENVAEPTPVVVTAEPTQQVAAPTTVPVTPSPVSANYDFILKDVVYPEVRYKISGSMPFGTTATQSSDGSAVVLEGFNFKLTYYTFYESEPVHFVSYLGINQHPQFGKYYRVRKEDDSKSYYVNTASGFVPGKDCQYTGATIPAPCGDSIMALRESKFIWVTCEADQAYKATCDEIVQNMRAEAL